MSNVSPKSEKSAGSAIAFPSTGSRRWCSRAFTALAVVLALPAAASAQTTWLSATAGGTWATAGNWSNGAPTTSGTAVLGNATANRSVITAASGTVGTLSITQTTAGVLNEFQMANPFAVTSPVTLGAASGTAQILVMSTSAVNTTGSFSGGITVNAGGVLAAGMYTAGSTAYTSDIRGNVTVSGGLVEVGSQSGPGSATGYHQIFNNDFTMTSGTLSILGAATRVLFLGTTGVVNVSGGTVLTAPSSNSTPGHLLFSGTSVNFSPATYTNNSGKVTLFSLDNLSNQTATFGQGWNNKLNLRNGGIKTVSMSSTATAFNNLRYADETTSGTLTLRLGSDLSFAALEAATTGSTVGGTTANFAFDTNGYAMRFSSTFTPVVSNTSAATNVFDLTGSGTIVAQRFTLNSGSTTVNVGAGLTLSATSAGVNTLSGSGTIDPTSTFRHAASGSSSLVSTRAVGNVEVTSGTLGITTLSAGGQAARAIGGTLDLAASGYTFASALVNGGVITNGTLTSAGLLDMRSGTVSAILAGTGNLAKTTSGTLTLSASNSYDGGTRIDAGTLRLGNANALGASSGALAVNGGTLDLGGFSVSVGALSGSSGATITTASTAGTATLTTDAASNSTFAGTIANNGSGLVALTKTGAGTLTLTAANSYSGATSVNAGTLAFDRVSALNSSSGIGIAAGAILDYTGAAGTLSRNVTVSSSGTGTIRNSGGQTLTLSGTLTKDGRVLRLTGGQFNVTGQIAGASANSDLLVDGTSTVTLSAVNSYNGPTFVNQASTLIVGINNAIPNNSTVTLGNASSAGTLDLGTFTDAISGLVFDGSGGTVKMAANQTASPQLSSTSALALGSNASLDLTGMQATAGNYRLISSTGISGTFGSVTGLDSNYLLRYGTVNSNEVSAQRKGEFGTVTATPAAATIITGGSTAFGYTVANATPTDGSPLAFTSANGANVAGSSSGTAGANATSASISGLVFTGTSVGLNQTGSFTLTDPNAIGSPANGSVSVNVLDHATSSLAGTLLTGTTISLGQWNYATNTWESGGSSGQFSIFNLASPFGASLTADLSLVSVSGTGNGFSTNLNTYTDIAGGTSQQYSISVIPGWSTSGTQSWTFTIGMSDKTGMSGATATNTLSVTANVIVVPEPGAIALAAIGIAAAAYALRRRK